MFDGSRYLYRKNAQGDIIGILDASGNLVVRYVYDSWGNCVYVYDASGKVITDGNNIGNVNPLRYRGYEYDTETGFYYLQSRYYDPVTGRFVNADGIIGANNSLNTNNLFAYCGNNPVNKSDPDGMRYIDDAFDERYNQVASSALAAREASGDTSSSASAVTKHVAEAIPAVGAATQKGQVHTINAGCKNAGKIRQWQPGTTDKIMTKGSYIGSQAMDAVTGASKMDRGCMAAAALLNGISNVAQYGFSKKCLVSWGVDMGSSLMIGMGSALLVATIVAIAGVTAPVAGVALAAFAIGAVASAAADPWFDKQKKKFFSMC